MQYQVFVKNESPERFVASVVGMNNVIEVGKTEEEAIDRIRLALEGLLHQGKFFSLEVPSPSEFPPMKYAGILADDSSFDDLVEKLVAIRKQENLRDDE